MPALSTRFTALEQAGFQRLEQAGYLKGLLQPFKGKGNMESRVTGATRAIWSHSPGFWVYRPA
jgi:hypothetical protein